MHWLRQLLEMYSEHDIPLYHDYLYTDICVELSNGGDFLGAKRSRIKTLVPITEKSAARTSGLCPHPLCDRLFYVAGDICNYLGEEQHFSAANVLYLRQLGGWAASQYAVDEIRAVNDYLSRKTLFGELLKSGVISGSEGRSAAHAAVRFAVGGNDLWSSAVIQRSHIAYVRSAARDRTLCCLTGEYAPAARLHPKRITGELSSAKLISSAPLPIGYESSFKAHAVLRRLISDSGVRLGSKVVTAWRYADNDVLTVLVLNEISRGALAVTFCGELTEAAYRRFCGECAADASGRYAEKRLCELSAVCKEVSMV